MAGDVELVGERVRVSGRRRRSGLAELAAQLGDFALEFLDAALELRDRCRAAVGFVAALRWSCVVLSGWERFEPSR